MATYDMNMKRTAGNAVSVGNITAPGSGMKRLRIWDVVYSSEAAPADAVVLHRAQRCTTAGTRTAVTPIPRDPADAAALTTAGENHTIEPTYTANNEVLEEAVNQRVTFRWQVDPLMGWVIPATANNGIGWLTPSPSPASLVTINVAFDEL